MNKLFILFLTVTVNIFSYDSVYLDICTVSSFKRGTPLTRLKDTCKNLESGKLNKNFYLDTKLQKDYKDILEKLRKQLDRSFTAKNTNMIVQYTDGMNLEWTRTEEEYYKHIKHLIKSAIEKENDFPGLTPADIEKIKPTEQKDKIVDERRDKAADKVLSAIKSILKEMRPLQFDLKRGSKIIIMCERNKQKSLTDDEAKAMCGITLEPNK